MGGGGGGGPPVPHLDPPMGPDYFYTYSDILKTHFIVRIGFASISRENRVFFLNFVIFFNSESSSTCFKDSCISLQKKLIDEMSSVIVLHYKRHLRRWRASEKRFGILKEERKCSDSSVVRG